MTVTGTGRGVRPETAPVLALPTGPEDPELASRSYATKIRDSLGGSFWPQVLVAKFLDHVPLYRQEAFFKRAGHLIARSTLAQWVGECGVQFQPLVQAEPTPDHARGEALFM